MSGAWFERYVNFEFYKTLTPKNNDRQKFERYVNFEFYKTNDEIFLKPDSLRDM